MKNNTAGGGIVARLFFRLLPIQILIVAMGSVTFLIGAALTAASLLIPWRLAGLFGAQGTLKTDLSIYTVGYAIGIIPQLLAQQLASFLQLERQSRLGYIGIIVMILVNVILDVVLVAILDMGVWGLALATSASNWAYFLILVSYYVLGKAQLKYRIRFASWKELPTLVKIGFPAALLVFALAVRKPGPFPAGTRSACRILPPSSVWPMRLM